MHFLPASRGARWIHVREHATVQKRQRASDADDAAMTRWRRCLQASYACTRKATSELSSNIKRPGGTSGIRRRKLGQVAPSLGAVGIPSKFVWMPAGDPAVIAERRVDLSR